MSDLTYAEVGATLRGLPTGYHHVELTAVIGTGPFAFHRAAEHLLTWGMHRSVFPTVRTTSPRVELGAEVSLGITAGPLEVAARCRVVAVIDEPDERGFAYGTLPGHPESGEELFLVRRAASGEVSALIRAFSRPATIPARLVGPIGLAGQRHITRRYLASLASS